MRGWLGKQGSVLPSFRRRYFVLARGLLLCYPDENCDAARARGYPVAGATVTLALTLTLTLALTLWRALR
jgi:hypothetical protein